MAEAFGTRTSKNLINGLRTSKRIGNSSRKQNLKKHQKTSNAPEPARQHSYQLLQIQPCWDFNNSIIEFRVPVSLALSLCQYVLRPRRGLGQASASKRLDCRLWKRDLFHQHNRKGKIVMIETSRYNGLVFGFVFGTWNWYDFWRRNWGLPCNWIKPCHGVAE